MSRRRFESVDRICRRWQRRYARQKMGVIKKTGRRLERIVLDGVVPAKVPDKIIAELRERERGGAVELPEAPGMRVSDRVRVTRGPLVGFAGLYVVMSGRQRIEVLLTMLGGQTRSILPKGDVELVPNPGGP
jgi:transcription antitermination factor NusG